MNEKNMKSNKNILEDGERIIKIPNWSGNGKLFYFFLLFYFHNARVELFRKKEKDVMICNEV